MNSLENMSPSHAAHPEAPGQEIGPIETTSCCIVGGGPAGAVLALLLARRGIPVALLEMHKDFDREFRGDTVHPSTMEILDQLGLAGKLGGLFLIDLFLGFFDQGHYVAHAQDASHDAVGVKRFQGIVLFADADELDRLARDLAD